MISYRAILHGLFPERPVDECHLLFVDAPVLQTFSASMNRGFAVIPRDALLIA